MAALMALLAVAAGVALVLAPEQQWVSGPQAAALALALTGLVQAVRERRRARSSWPRTFGWLALVPAGALLPGLSDLLFVLALYLIAGVVVARGLLTAAVRAGLTGMPAGTGRVSLSGWVEGLGSRPQQRAALLAQVLFEGPSAGSRVLRFTLLMGLASVISAMGVLTDSTAVLIGAMLVAPLITPMMGMALSLAMGWPARLARSTLLVLLGVGIAVGTGLLLAAVTGLGTDLNGNSQVLSRSSPTTADLLIAVAAGATGAYALSRSDVSSSLPGVAIAIALVPPLSVVGITLEAGDAGRAGGTLLLFLTNLVAILLVGGTVFVLTGVAPLHRVRTSRAGVRTAAAAVLALAVLVVVGLALNGVAITGDALANDQARVAIAGWLGPDTEFELVSLSLTGSDVTVVLAGPGRPPGTGALAARLADRLDRPVRLDLQWVPRQRERATAVPP